MFAGRKANNIYYSYQQVTVGGPKAVESSSIKRMNHGMKLVWNFSLGIDANDNQI